MGGPSAIGAVAIGAFFVFLRPLPRDAVAQNVDEVRHPVDAPVLGQRADRAVEEQPHRDLCFVIRFYFLFFILYFFSVQCLGRLAG